MITRVVMCQAEGYPHEESGLDADYSPVFWAHAHNEVTEDDADEDISICIDPVEIPDFKHEDSGIGNMMGGYNCTCGDAWTIYHESYLKREGLL